MMYTLTSSPLLIREPRGSYTPSQYYQAQPEQLFDEVCILFQQRFRSFQQQKKSSSFQEEEALRIMLEGLISMKNLMISGSLENQE